MPLTAKGKKLKKKFKEQYGKKKGEKVFYAMESSGKLKKVIKAVSGRDAGMGMSGKSGNFGGDSKGKGRDPSAQFKDKTTLSQKSRQALTEQRERARGRISPSTTPVGKAIAGTIGAITGMPYLGYQLGKRMVDRSPMAFGVPKSTRAKKDTTPRDRDRDGSPPIQPVIAGPIPINQPMNQLIPIPRIRPTVSPTGVFNYGFKKGGLLRQGKPKLAKKGWK